MPGSRAKGGSEGGKRKYTPFLWDGITAYAWSVIDGVAWPCHNKRLWNGVKAKPGETQNELLPWGVNPSPVAKMVNMVGSLSARRQKSRLKLILELSSAIKKARTADYARDRNAHAKCPHGKAPQRCPECTTLNLCPHGRLPGVCTHCRTDRARGGESGRTRRTAANGGLTTWEPRGSYSLATENSGTAKLSVGDFFDTREGEVFVAFHNDVHECNFNDALSIFRRVYLEFGMTPADLMPAKFNESEINSRIEKMKAPVAAVHRHGSWCWLTSVLSRRLLQRLIPFCQCGGASCASYDMSEVDLSLINFDHFHCTKELGEYDEPHKLFTRHLSGPPFFIVPFHPSQSMALFCLLFVGVNLEKVKYLRVVHSRHHDNLQPSTSSDPPHWDTSDKHADFTRRVKEIVTAAEGCEIDDACLFSD
jgi:hypothetical protein